VFIIISTIYIGKGHIFINIGFIIMILISIYIENNPYTKLPTLKIERPHLSTSSSTLYFHLLLLPSTFTFLFSKDILLNLRVKKLVNFMRERRRVDSPTKRV